VRYWHGFYYVEALNSNAYSCTGRTQAVAYGEAQSREALGGNGASLDLAGNFYLPAGWHASLIMQNFGFISWQKKTRLRQAQFSLLADNIEHLLEKNSDVDSVVSSSSSTTDIAGFRVNLPALLRLGLHHSTQYSIWTLEWQQSLTNALAAYSRWRLALATEQQLTGFLALRAGFFAGGSAKAGFSFGAGLTFGAFRWDVAMLAAEGPAPGSIKGLELAQSCSIGL